MINEMRTTGFLPQLKQWVSALRFYDKTVRAVQMTKFEQHLTKVRGDFAPPINTLAQQENKSLKLWRQ